MVALWELPDAGPLGRALAGWRGGQTSPVAKPFASCPALGVSHRRALGLCWREVRSSHGMVAERDLSACPYQAPSSSPHPPPSHVGPLWPDLLRLFETHCFLESAHLANLCLWLVVTFSGAQGAAWRPSGDRHSSTHSKETQPASESGPPAVRVGRQTGAAGGLQVPAHTWLCIGQINCTSQCI